MSKYLIIFGLLTISCLSINLHHHADQELPVVGGVSEIDLDNLSEGQKEIDSWIREQMTDLEDAELIVANEQVVNGMLYNYGYQNQDKDIRWKVRVWDQASPKKREITHVEEIKMREMDGNLFKKTTKLNKSTSFEDKLVQLFN